MMKILAAGGGTKGHAFPLKEILREIKKRADDVEIFLLGVKEFEKEIAEELGARFIKVDLRGLPRKPGLQLLTAGIKALTETIKCIYLTAKIKPDFVIVAGGYTSIPASIAALVLKVPLYIQEQNSVMGLANRLASVWAKKIFLGLPLKNELKKGKEKFVFTGNPVRPEAITRISKKEALESLGLKAGLPAVLVFGGSQGAKALNDAFLRLFFWMEKENKELPQFILLTGKKNFEEFEEKGKSLFKNWPPAFLKVFPEWDEMGILYAASDLVVSRAGASTVSELAFNGKPGILVPYPYATENHQYYNALYLVKNNAGKVLLNESLENLSSEELYGLIMETLNNREIFASAKKLSENVKKFLPQNVIADIILNDLKNA